MIYINKIGIKSPTRVDLSKTQTIQPTIYLDYIVFLYYFPILKHCIDQSAGAVKYTNCFSA